MIALELAARHPSLPSVLVAVAPGPIDPPQKRQVYEGLVRQLEGPDGEAVRLAFVQGNFLATDDAERRRRIVETMCAVPLPIATAVMRGGVAWNGVSALKLGGVPLLVILSHVGGANDPAGLLALKPDLQIGVAVGAGHLHQLEVPEQVTPMIARFLQISVPCRS
jgi:pimeloyl-ACP methyl ester carboxylesterase